MCGIAGLIDPSRSREQIQAAIERMLPGIASRGPDGTGRFCDDGIGLLHTRLAIIDLATGDQPIWNEDRTVACVFNGEIYNYRELRDQLAARGHRLGTTTDTEVLVHLYEDYGDDLLRHVHGMYAFAIYDVSGERVLLARDRLGIKPLYLGHVRSGLAFASAIGSVLGAGVSRDVDPEAMVQYFRFRRVPEPRTAYRGIRALAPGCSLIFDLRRGRTEERRHHHRPRPAGTDGDLSARLRDARSAFEGAVSSHLVADVEVAAFLSGGIDSSLVVAQAQRLSSRPLRTFCVSFKGDTASDEAPFAERVARCLGTRHSTIEVSSAPTELVRSSIVAAQQPFAVASFLPLLLLCERASSQVKVVLTGDGGDEVGAGYPWYRWAAKTARIPRRGSARLMPAIHRAERVAGMSPRLRAARRALKFAHGAFAGGPAGSDAWRYNMTASEAVAALHPEFRSGVRALTSPTEEAWDGGLGPVDALRCADLEVLLRDEMLPKLDRAGMYFGLEGRVPLLDDDFVDAMLAVPIRTHLADPHGKALLRSWAAEIVPGIDLTRRKHGFDVPIHEWLRGALFDDVDRLLLRPSRPGLIDPSFARSLWRQASAGIPGAGHDVYGLLVGALWFERAGSA